MTKILARSLDTPIGPIHLRVDTLGVLVALDFDEGAARIDTLLEKRRGAFERVDAHGNAADAIADRLRAYFAGVVRAIDAIAVDTGGTVFQRACWAELRRIPAGGTRSYLEEARAIGRPAAVRAVGQANGANPIPIVVPCHRVIAADGSLGGYSAGLTRKTWLLAHEARFVARDRDALRALAPA